MNLEFLGRECFYCIDDFSDGLVSAIQVGTSAFFYNFTQACFGGLKALSSSEYKVYYEANCVNLVENIIVFEVYKRRIEYRSFDFRICLGEVRVMFFCESKVA
jgi:hypothetical protein